MVTNLCLFNYPRSRPQNKKKWGKRSTYIGAGLAKFQVKDTGEIWWSMCGDIYIYEDIKMVKEKLSVSDQQSYKKTNSDIQTCYQPDLDVAPVLGNDQDSY